MIESIIVLALRIGALILVCLLSYVVGKYKAYTKIYEEVLKEYIRTHFEENFQDDVNNKKKEL
jgi:hypothetical protein